MRRSAATLVIVLSAAFVPAARADDPLAALHASCHPTAALIICAAKIPSFDGTPLDATLTFPGGRPPRRGRPLMVFLHGLLADKTEYLSDTVDGAGADRGSNVYKTVHFNNRWFASRGAVVLNYSARGQGASGGSIELGSKDFEVRDTRYLTGLLADASWTSIRPSRVAVYGSSFGGGQAWMLLTTRDAGSSLPYGQWRSPGGRVLKLAAVIPAYTWSDLVQSLMPNGHEDSRRVTDPATIDSPLGVSKITLSDGFIASAGTKLPTESIGWLLRTTAGEPYDPSTDGNLAAAKRALTFDRSGYFQNAYFDALAADTRARHAARVHHRRVPARRQPLVPVLAAQGWTDPIFAPIEALRMWRRLRSASPGYPISLYLGDFEHLTSLVKIPDLRQMHDEATSLLDATLFGRGRRARPDVRAEVTDCDPKRLGPLLRAPSWDSLATHNISFDSQGPFAMTSLPGLDLRGPGLDPVVASQLRGRGCFTTTTPPVPASWTVTPPAPFTMAGLPRLTLKLTVAGVDATLAARLWDVAPDGVATLVTRGILRLAPPPSPGTPIVAELFGNAWHFAAGHRIQLELSQTDATYFRPDNLPSAIVVDSVHMDLPAV